MCDLEKNRLDWLSAKVNRSKSQTQLLFNLVDGDFEKLLQLEMQLYNCFVWYCPGDKEDVEEVMKLVPKNKYLVLEEPEFYEESEESKSSIVNFEDFSDEIVKKWYMPEPFNKYWFLGKKELYSFEPGNKFLRIESKNCYWEEFDVILAIKKV